MCQIFIFDVLFLLNFCFDLDFFGNYEILWAFWKPPMNKQHFMLQSKLSSEVEGTQLCISSDFTDIWKLFL
jgi:hypothetical protein